MSTTKTGLFEAINLDDLSVDPADLTSVSITFTTLARYARLKADAMRHRGYGNIGVALILERDLERTYAMLPEWARW